ncbi:hypothetical protein ACFROC_01050 [Nocardia tengchongensis]|uniref:hypothetical protein n=1 Tax=Nocardia tengchongensis TaxID=2055889 RepID=UPI0036894552
MGEPTPTLVVVYELVDTDYQRMAEFRLTPHGTVTLVLRQPGCCPLAQGWYSEGVGIRTDARRVTREDGQVFMRALLQTRPMSYCRVVDESADAPAGSGTPWAASNPPWSS